MAVTLELDASYLELNYGGLNVHVARSHFTSKQWERLWEMLKQARERLEWLRLPFRTSKQEGARWKKICLEVFSMVVYILLIPPSHIRLRSLLRTLVSPLYPESAMQLPQHHVHARDTLFTPFVTTSWTPCCDRSPGYYSAKKFPVNIFEMKSKALLFFGKENTRSSSRDSTTTVPGSRMAQLLPFLSVVMCVATMV